MSGIITDATGLHAETCGCASCELGLRPTELERAAARRALVVKLAADARRVEAEKAKVAAVKSGRVRYPVEPPRKVVPPTPAEWEELRKLREGFRR